jgi:hydrogenase expression/formation protein HypC
MCLGVPGKVVAKQENDLGMTVGRVSFGGIIKDVSLAYLPEVRLGDYVIVHVGFALSRVDEEAAKEIFSFLRSNSELSDLEGSGSPRGDESSIPGGMERGGKSHD